MDLYYTGYNECKLYVCVRISWSVCVCWVMGSCPSL